jgi:SAM-dependent methyltransferase
MLKIYQEYQLYGIEEYYKNFSCNYFNPHEEKIKQIYLKYIKDLINHNDKIIDIACGNGLVSRLVHKYNNNYNIVGCDPFFNNAYCKLNLSFEDIAKGKLETNYDLGICSYAYHLLDHKWRYDFLTQLSLILNKFIIITPSKKIQINHPLWKVDKYLREDKITLIILEKI